MIPYALALLACLPKYTGLPPLEPAGIATPLPMKHVTVQGTDIAYVDSGGGKPPIVLIHGLSSYASYWEYQIPELAKTHRVLALDLPGYGASGRPDAPCTPPWYADVVAEWMVAVGAPRAPVMGHSMGGQIALTLAIEHPERVSALVLSAPAGFETFTPGAASFMKSYWHESRALEATETELRIAFTQTVFNRVDAGVERLLEERVRMSRTAAFRGTSVAVSRSIAGMVDHPVAGRLGEIAVPTLIVYGTDDRMIPNPVFTGGRTKAVAERGQRAIAGAELVMIPGAGHTVHHDAPETFNGTVATFLGRLRPEGTTIEVLDEIRFQTPSPAPTSVVLPAPASDDAASVWGKE